jgi:iron complex outermembrane receptor protein
MKRVIFAILLLGVFQSVIAQNNGAITISGKVEDAENGLPLSGAEVVLSGTNRGGVTNKHGLFSLQISKGEVVLVASHIGYEPALFRFKALKDTSLTIKLNPEVFKVQEVVVSAGVSSQHENAIKIDAINSKDILTSSQNNIITAVRETPGVDLISRGNGIAQPVIRGLTSNNIVVLINGIRLENFQFSINHPFMVDDWGINKIEIIKGPASLLYGSDAMGGAINFITTRHVEKDTIMGNVVMKGFSNGLGFASGYNFTFSRDKFYVKSSGGIKNSADYYDATGRRVYNTCFSSNEVSTTVGYVGATNNFNVFFRELRPKLGLYVPAFDTSQITGVFNHNAWYQDLTDRLFIANDKIKLENAEINIKVSYQQNNRKLHAANSVPINMNMNTLFSDVNYVYRSNNIFEIITGVQGMHKIDVNNNAPGKIIPDATVQSGGAYSIARLHLRKHFVLQGGTRLDVKSLRNDETGVQKDFAWATWSAGLTYKPIEKLLLRANVSSGFRTPDIPELYQNGLHGDRYEIGDPALKPQRNIEYDLGMHIHGSKAYIDFSTFLNDIYGYIYLSPGAAAQQPSYFYRQNDAKLYGGELSAYFRPLNSVNVGYTFSFVKGEKLNGDPLPFIPQPKLKGVLKYRINKLGKFEYIFAELNPVYAFAKSDVPMLELVGNPYFLLNLKLGTDVLIADYRLSAGVNFLNLTNTVYYDRLSTLANYGFYNPGININAYLKFNF